MVGRRSLVGGGGSAGGFDERQMSGEGKKAADAAAKD